MKGGQVSNLQFLTTLTFSLEADQNYRLPQQTDKTSRRFGLIINIQKTKTIMTAKTKDTIYINI